MEEFSVMQIEEEEQGELEEVLDMAHQHMFSSTTPAGTVLTAAATGEPVVLVEHSQHTTITTVNYNHTGNHGNGDSAQETSQGGLTEVSYGDGDALIGRSVVKNFSQKKFTGRIVAYDPHTRWYKIVYEDADEEELDWKELERILVPVTDSLPAASKKRPPPINVTAGKENRPAKRPRGRPPKVGTAKSKTLKKPTQIPKATKAKSKEVSAQKPSRSKTLSLKKGQTSVNDKQGVGEVSETVSTAKKAAGSPWTPKSEKAGLRRVGRPKKAESIKPQFKKMVGRKRKIEVKDGGDSSSESRPSTRRSTLTIDQDESNSRRISGAKAGAKAGAKVGAKAGAKAGAKVGAKAGASLIGRRTKKKFGNKYFGGEVIGFDPKANFYKVQYDDGDEEELEWAEVEMTLVVEEQLTLAKTRQQASQSNGLESPLKKQKLVSPKKVAGKTERQKVVSPKKDAGKTEKQKVVSPKKDAGKTERQKVVSPKKDAGKTEKQKVVSPKKDAGKTERQKGVSLKKDAGKTERQKVVSPKKDAGNTKRQKILSPKKAAGKTKRQKVLSLMKDAGMTKSSTQPQRKGAKMRRHGRLSSRR